jgi:general nucleoside transport system permease protein
VIAMDAGQISFWGVLLGGAVRLATPITLAALGETLVERGGIVNLGIEGMMALGAFLGVWGASTQSWGTGLLLGAIAGGSLGLLMGLAVLKGGVNQIVAGIAITLLGIGLADYLFQVWQPSGRSAVVVPLVPIVRLPLFERLPVIGGAFFAQSPLTYLAVVAVLVTSFALRRTTPGLKLRAVGDDPDAAELRGVDVIAARIVSLILGGALAGFAGATITVGYLGSFSSDVTAGRGYVAIAVVIIGRWSPIGAMLGALVFALFDSVALLAQSGSMGLPVEFFSSLPYAMTLVALVLTARAHHAPRALGRGLND